MTWKLVRQGPNAHTIHAPYPAKESWALWLSDIHFDNPKCDRKLLKRHLTEAVKKKAPVFIIGDFFCAMQGKYDPRSNKASIRTAHLKTNYLDAIVDEAAEWLKPFKKNVAIIGLGNHETAILNKQETNLVDRLAAKLRDAGGITMSGGYGGWIRYQFQRKASMRGRVEFYYHHGFGGGGASTFGVNHFPQYMTQVRADVYVCGHHHYRTNVTHVVAERTQTSIIKHVPIDFVRCGTYKDDYKDGDKGWHIEKGLGPRVRGGYWLRWVPHKGRENRCIPARQFIPTEAGMD